MIALARSEQDLVEVHVQNALDVFDAVGEELPLDRVIEIYLDAMDVAEPRASIVAQSVMARLEGGGARSRRSNRTRPRREE